jgi:hypothetical protein
MRGQEWRAGAAFNRCAGDRRGDIGARQTNLPRAVRRRRGGRERHASFILDLDAPGDIAVHLQIEFRRWAERSPVCEVRSRGATSCGGCSGGLEFPELGRLLWRWRHCDRRVRTRPGAFEVRDSLRQQVTGRLSAGGGSSTHFRYERYIVAPLIAAWMLPQSERTATGQGHRPWPMMPPM